MIEASVESEDQLEAALSEPTEGVVETLRRLPGDIILLGVAGKMGPSLARMARQASDAAAVRRRVIGVSRFTSAGREALEEHGVETVACDLLDEGRISRLPDAANVVFLAGRKFGSTGDESSTWAVNCYAPGLVCRRYRGSRIVAFSTGNVYGLVPVSSGGSREGEEPRPVGEYAMSCLGRERVFEHFSREPGTPTTLIGLNYACDLRYVVLVDLASRIKDGEAVDLGMGYLNTIWQSDANAMALRALDLATSPPVVLNVTGPGVLSARAVGEWLARLIDKPVRFSWSESATAFLSDGRRGLDLLGSPRVDAGLLTEWVARWVARGGASLNKPTHFESRDGRF